CTKGLSGHRFFHVTKSTLMESSVRLAYSRDDMHRNMPQVRIVFKTIEHGPSVHIGQSQIKCYSIRSKSGGHRQCSFTCGGNYTFESMVAHFIKQQSGEMQIVLDNKQYAIILLQAASVVCHGAFNQVRRVGGHCRIKT